MSKRKPGRRAPRHRRHLIEVKPGLVVGITATREFAHDPKTVEALKGIAEAIERAFREEQETLDRVAVAEAALSDEYELFGEEREWVGYSGVYLLAVERYMAAGLPVHDWKPTPAEQERLDRFMPKPPSPESMLTVYGEAKPGTQLAGLASHVEVAYTDLSEKRDQALATFVCAVKGRSPGPRQERRLPAQLRLRLL